MIQVFVDGVVAVDGEAGDLDRPAADLQDQVVQELGDGRRPVETNHLENVFRTIQE